jgi:hypothetical protein
MRRARMGNEVMPFATVGLIGGWQGLDDLMVYHIRHGGTTADPSAEAFYGLNWSVET